MPSFVRNRFGEATVYFAAEMSAPIYATSAACMSIWSEFLSWANVPQNAAKMTTLPSSAASIVVLSCQVTDLAVLNDLRTLERLMQDNPGATFYVGGCLAQRCDIPLPSGVRRLGRTCADYQPIFDKGLVHYEPPFWARDWNEQGGTLAEGHLFRNHYPLRISVGCAGKCEYCTIRVTRGTPYDLQPIRSIPELLYAYQFRNEPVVLIADSPRVDLLRDWLRLARRAYVPMAIRNVEPHVANELRYELVQAAEGGYLTCLHSPIQSSVPDVLRAMGRSAEDAVELLETVRLVKRSDPRCVTATNVIIDYKGMPDDLTAVREAFDYVSWNPYWDGRWDRAEAERRYETYLGSNPAKTDTSDGEPKPVAGPH